MRLETLALGLLCSGLTATGVTAGSNPFMRPGQLAMPAVEVSSKSVFASTSTLVSVEREDDPAVPAPVPLQPSTTRQPAPASSSVGSNPLLRGAPKNTALPAKGLPTLSPQVQLSPPLPPVIPAQGATVVKPTAFEAASSAAPPSKAVTPNKAAAEAARARMSARKAQCHPTLVSPQEAFVASRGAGVQVQFKRLSGCVDGVSVFDVTGAALSWLTIQRVSKDSVYLLTEENLTGQERRASLSVITPSETFLITVVQPATTP